MITMQTTVKLHWIQSPVNDPFTRDTFALADSDFYAGEFAYVNEAEEYVLPAGYSVSQTKYGETAVFDERDQHCDLDCYHGRARLISSTRVVSLEKAEEGAVI